MRKKESWIAIAGLLVLMFLAMLYFTSIKSPAIVIEFNNNDIVLKKIGVVGFFESMNMYCEGNYVKATIRTPSGNQLICSKDCVSIIGVERVYCNELPKEDGTYSITIEIYENSDNEKLINSKQLSGSWQD